MHPTIVTMMISVFRGPSVPPVGSLCRLLAVVAIVVAAVSGTSETSETDGFHSYFLSCLFIDSTPTVGGKDAVCLPIASKCFSSKKKLSVFTSMFAAWQTVERYRPHNRKRFDNFHSIFPFRAPLTEMTRLLLVGCFKCTQFNLSFRFTFLLQSRSSLRFGNQLLHNLRGMEKSY